jgi:hypothetical protein
LFKKTFLIRPAVGDSARHPLHDTFRRQALPNQVDYSRDAAHDLIRIN